VSALNSNSARAQRRLLCNAVRRNAYKCPLPTDTSGGGGVGGRGWVPQINTVVNWLRRTRTGARGTPGGVGVML